MEKREVTQKLSPGVAYSPVRETRNALKERSVGAGGGRVWGDFIC